MRVLVTGASGFTGKWLLHHLQRIAGKQVEITGLIHSRVPKEIDCTRIQLLKADLNDYHRLERCFSIAVPDAVIHLAGTNRAELHDLMNTNVIGTQNLLRVLTKLNDACRILIVSSSAVYGYHGDSPITESSPCYPVTEYGVSKLTQEMICQMFCRREGLSIAVARPFNLFGPGLPMPFVCASIIRQVIAIDQGNKECIDLMDINSRRDFIDVRDAIEAYWSLISHPQFDEDCKGKAFNVGSGKPVSISGILECIENITGNKYPVHVSTKLSRELIPSQQSNNMNTTRVTGWMPKIPLEKTLTDMLETERSVAIK